MTLYEITQAQADWLAKLEANEGEVNQELAIEFELINKDFNAKAESYAIIIKQYKADADALGAEEKRIKERRERALTIAENLKNRLAETMNYFSKDKFETPKCKISFRNSEAVKIKDESLIPEKYIKEVTTKSPMLTEIKAAIKAGEDIQGAEIVKNKHIQVG